MPKDPQHTAFVGSPETLDDLRTVDPGYRYVVTDERPGTTYEAEVVALDPRDERLSLDMDPEDALRLLLRSKKRDEPK